MPISTLKIDKERTLSALADAAFEIKGPRAKELKKRAEEVLLRANPGLGSRSGFKRGTVVVVPDVSGAKPQAEKVPASPSSAVLFERMTAGLVAIEALGAEATKRVKEREKETTANLKSASVKKDLEKHPGLKKRLDGLGARAQRRTVEVQARAKTLSEAVRKAMQDIEGMKKGPR